MLYTNSFSDTAMATVSQLKNVKFNEEKYRKYLHTLVHYKSLAAKQPDFLIDLTTDIEEDLCQNLFFREKESMDLLERLLIGNCHNNFYR
jgi:hypothetical protein